MISELEVHVRIRWYASFAVGNQGASWGVVVWGLVGGGSMLVGTYMVCRGQGAARQEI